MLAPEIFTRARHWPRLAIAHTENRVGDPLTKFLGPTFKIGLKIPHMSAYNFGGSGRNLTKLYQGTWLEACVIKWTLILQGVPLQNLGGQKSEIQRDF